MREHVMKRLINPVLVVFFLVTIWVPGAKAAVVSTQSLISSQGSEIQSELQTALAREDVRQELMTMGVDPLQVDARVAALTPEELRLLQQNIKDMPAGSSALAVIGAVFLVLLILELVGVTNIFTNL